MKGSVILAAPWLAIVIVVGKLGIPSKIRIKIKD